MSDKITIVVPVKAKPEYREKLKQKLQKLSCLSNQEEGNICYVLHQVADNSEQFIIYEQWKNQKALDYHMNQDYLKTFLIESKKMLLEEIHGTICYQVY